MDGGDDRRMRGWMKGNSCASSFPGGFGFFVRPPLCCSLRPVSRVDGVVLCPVRSESGTVRIRPARTGKTKKIVREHPLGNSEQGGSIIYSKLQGINLLLPINSTPRESLGWCCPTCTDRGGGR